MDRQIVILGSGAHARVVHDILLACGEGQSVAAFVDVDGDGPGGASVSGRPLMSGLDEFDRYIKTHDVTAIIGHGNNSRRRAIMGWLDQRGMEAGNAVHPSAVISPDVDIAPGTTVSAGAVILTGSRIGRAVIINTAATIDHDCVVDDFAQLAPGAHLAGRVHVQEGAFIGIGAAVIQNLTVGRGCVIGAGAAVVRAAPEHTLVIGVPGRVRRQL